MLLIRVSTPAEIPAQSCHLYLLPAPWRTIQTWYSRYQKHGVTVMENQPRFNKGKTRKVSLEMVQEAIDAVYPKVHGAPKRAVLYRLCLEQGLLTRALVAPNTFSRMVKQYDMLKPPTESENKQRLAITGS